MLVPGQLQRGHDDTVHANSLLFSTAHFQLDANAAIILKTTQMSVFEPAGLRASELREGPSNPQVHPHPRAAAGKRLAGRSLSDWYATSLGGMVVKRACAHKFGGCLQPAIPSLAVAYERLHAVPPESPHLRMQRRLKRWYLALQHVQMSL